MIRAIIFYFSGTGNTERVVGMLKDSLHREGVHVDCSRIDRCLRDGVMPDISGYDAVGIGYPVFAFNVPEPVEHFVRRLPGAEGKPVFVVKTAGEPFVFNQTSSHCIGRMLSRRGYEITYEANFLMPYNILFRYPDAVVKQLCRLAERLAEKMASDLASGVRAKPRYNPLLVLISAVMRIQQPGARLNGKLQRAAKACVRCGKCVRECPMGNIRMTDKGVKFGWQCTMCMRCVMYCPMGAVKAGIIEPLAVRGGYDFDRIIHDPDIADRYIEHCDKGFFRHFKQYVREVTALTGENEDRRRMDEAAR